MIIVNSVVHISDKKDHTLSPADHGSGFNSFKTCKSFLTIV